MAGEITRRGALRLLGLAAAGAPLAGPAAAAAPATRGPTPAYRLGVASYSLRGMPLDRALAAVRRLGLNSISINRAHLSWEHPAPGWAAAVPQCAAAGVDVRCCGVMTLKKDEAAVRADFAFARTLGVKVIACSPEPDALPLVERCTQEFGIRAAIHNHGPEDKVFPSPHEVWRAVQPFAGIGLCLDVGHAYRAGADPAECVRSYRTRLWDLHLKDSVAPVGAEDIPIEVGRGRMDIPGVLTALAETGYDRMVWFEFEKDAADPLPGLAESIGWVRGWLVGMGLDAAALNRIIS